MFIEQFEALLCESVGEQTQTFSSIGNIIEGSFDQKERTADLVVIKKGWSANGFYYSQSAIDSIAEHINSGSAERVYLDHNPKTDLFRPRKVEDHIANNVRARVEGDKVIATAKFFESGPNSWVWDRVKENKTNFGPSITGKAKLVKGEVDGRKGFIVEEVKFLNSYDIVAAPAAGGSVASVSEAEEFGDKGHLSFLTDSIVVEAAGESKGLGDRLKSIKANRESRSKFSDLRWMTMDLVDDLIFAKNEFSQASVDDRKGAVSTLLKELETEILKLTFAEPIKIVKTKEEIESGIKQTMKATILIEGEGEMEIKSLADLKKDTVLFEALLEEASKTNEATEKVESWKKDSDELKQTKTDLVEAKTKIDTLTKEKEDIEKKVNELSESVKKYEAETAKAARALIISGIKKEAGLAEEDCSEIFNADLNAVVFESEDEFKKAIKARVDERVSLIKETEKKKKIHGNGPTQKIAESKNNSDSDIPTAEILANRLKKGF